MNNKTIKLLALTATLMPMLGFALSPEAARILSKKNRKLSAPPKSLKANQANVDLRYASGRKRMAASNDVQTIPVTNPSDYSSQSPTMSFEYSSSASKLERVFGLGFVAAGAYGVFGVETDFSLMDAWTFGFGLGTGMTYSSWGAHSRYLFRQGEALTPFVELGYSNWHLGKLSSREADILPLHLANRFFQKNPNGSLVEGDTAHIIYPGFGVNYIMKSGLAVTAQVQYMIHLRDFSGGLAGSTGLYYYF